MGLLKWLFVRELNISIGLTFCPMKPPSFLTEVLHGDFAINGKKKIDEVCIWAAQVVFYPRDLACDWLNVMSNENSPASAQNT